MSLLHFSPLARKARGRCSRGAALPSVLCILGILAAVSAAVFFIVTNRFRTIHHSSAWQEALIASEAGVHQAMAQLERSLKQSSLPAGEQTFRLDLPHAGETSAGAEVEYTLRRTELMRSGMPRPYYSIVSKGTVHLPGSLSLSNDKRDVVLRKLRLRNRVATRAIEAWAQPVTSADFALKVDKQLVLNNHRIEIDSFDSSDANRSLPNGQPPNTIGQFNVAPHNIMGAHIGTNSEFIAGGNATVYGDAYTNGGTVGNSSGILGAIYDDHYEPLAPVFAPSWAGTVTPGVQTASGFSASVTSAATLRGGTAANPARYVIDDLSVAGNTDVVTFDFGLNGQSKPDPDKAYVELYVRGDLNTKGGGNSESIVISKGVFVRIWFGGDVHMTGNGSSNEGGVASSLSLYGINAPVPKPGQTVNINGNSTFFGTIYAPSADLHLSGGGSKGAFVGSLTGKNAFLKGNVEIRYDEALAGTGIITRFKLVSWFEDTKPAGEFPGTL